MRHAFWLLVIAFSISALWGGYLSGRAAVPHFPAGPATAAPQAAPAPDLGRAVAQTDELAEDRFARDAAVSTDAPGGDPGEDSQLALVVVDAGHSVALESPFLFANVPLTLVIDPAGTAAGELLRLAAQSGDAVYLQASEPVTAARVRSLHAAFPRARGIAVRMTGAAGVTASARRALRDAGLGIFDEYGENRELEKIIAAAGVRYAARSITVDDHVQRSYVTYMLRQAVNLGRGRTAVVMARPFPGTLHAFEDLLAQAPRDGVRFVGLP